MAEWFRTAMPPRMFLDDLLSLLHLSDPRGSSTAAAAAIAPATAQPARIGIPPPPPQALREPRGAARPRSQQIDLDIPPRPALQRSLREGEVDGETTIGHANQPGVPNAAGGRRGAPPTFANPSRAASRASNQGEWEALITDSQGEEPNPPPAYTGGPNYNQYAFAASAGANLSPSPPPLSPTRLGDPFSGSFGRTSDRLANNRAGTSRSSSHNSRGRSSQARATVPEFDDSNMKMAKVSKNGENQVSIVVRTIISKRASRSIGF